MEMELRVLYHQLLKLRLEETDEQKRIASPEHGGCLSGRKGRNKFRRRDFISYQVSLCMVTYHYPYGDTVYLRVLQPGRRP